MTSLVTGFFLRSKPSVASTLDNLIPWLDVSGNMRRHSPRIFLNLFDKLPAILKEVEEKFRKAADDKKASSALPQWGEIYHLGDLEKFYKSPKINKSFSRLLSKPVSTSRYVSLSLDESAKLESCIRGQIELQSFSLWAVAAIFEFLKESDCVPGDAVFHQLVSSITTSINSQARASFSAAALLKQKRRENLVSHLPPSAHPWLSMPYCRLHPHPPCSLWTSSRSP